MTTQPQSELDKVFSDEFDKKQEEKIAEKQVIKKEEKAPATAKKEDTIFDLIEKSKSQMALAVPNSLSVDRLARVFVTELRKNPKLMACSKMSLMSAMMQTAQLGLEVGVMGHAYLIPYKTECQLIIGYKGLVSMALRSGKVKAINAQIVYEDDDFDFQLGTDSFLKHKPKFDGSGKPIAVYAVASLDDGSRTFDVMSMQEVDAIRSRSKSSESGPWVTDFVEMAKKCVVRRFCKMLPISAEAQELAAKDELEDFGIKKNYKDAVNTEAKSIDDLVFKKEEN